MKWWCCCSCSIVAAGALISRQKANQMLWDAVYLLSIDLVHRSHLIFWMHSKLSWCCCCCCCCSCSCSAFSKYKAKNVANCMIRDVIYSFLEKWLYRCSLIFIIDSKECCHCSCSCSCYRHQVRLVKAENWIIWNITIKLSFMQEKCAAAAVAVLQLQQ